MLDKRLLPNNISLKQFKQLLSRYRPLIESISSTKAPKPGQKTLLELDHFRYHEAINLFQPEKTSSPMTLDNVKTLVDWKLRHGKFRPTLMKLVSSNDEELVKNTIQEAIEKYRESSDAPKALIAISKLKGIGPATASLLLSVYDPDNVIFFSDEAFYWLCCDGKISPIKYNAKEYQELSSAAQSLIQRLGTSAVDIERVAYVLMKDDLSQITLSDIEETPTSDAKPAQVESSSKQVKRKKNDIGNSPDHQTPVRRSKRGKAS
ncbi:hypothetical protein F5Y02DRAFT_281443 [Annulohypoxylon stygium]|nr:hypothetical protein F5Y02DRAFT_281443 [Annulohypoxylon stygium]